MLKTTLAMSSSCHVFHLCSEVFTFQSVAGLMLAHRLRRWSNNKPALGICISLLTTGQIVVINHYSQI